MKTCDSKPCIAARIKAERERDKALLRVEEVYDEISRYVIRYGLEKLTFTGNVGLYEALKDVAGNIKVMKFE